MKRIDSEVVASRSSSRVEPFQSGLAVYSSATAPAVFSFWPVPDRECTRSTEVPRRRPGASVQRFFRPMAASTSPPDIASRMRYSLNTRPSFM